MRFDVTDIDTVVVHRIWTRPRTEPIEFVEVLEDDEPSVIVDLRYPLPPPTMIARGSTPRIRIAAGTTPPELFEPSAPSDGIPVDIIDDD